MHNDLMYVFLKRDTYVTGCDDNYCDQVLP